MKKFLMNKNVEHNGKSYAKGSEIKEGEPGFKDIVQAGHAVAVEDKAEIKVEQEEKPEQPQKPAGKSNK